MSWNEAKTAAQDREGWFQNVTALCMVQFYLLPSPPGNPGDKSSPSVPGVGNCLKLSCPGGRGAGQIENNCLLFL